MRRGNAFTLIELLVVVGIIAVLISILLPVLSAARRSANDIKCASNIRQICLALHAYGADHKGKFPPNKGNPSSADMTGYWYDQERIGSYLGGISIQLTARVAGLHHRPGLGGGVFVCPNDEDSARSYAMNRWASCLPVGVHPTVGALNFGVHVRQGSKIILVTEIHSIYPSSEGFASIPNYAPLIGIRPARAFGAEGGTNGTWGNTNERYHTTPTAITYVNHRRRGEGEGTEPKGRINIGYCDGHVEMKRHDQLADFAAGTNKFDSLWSPKDYELEKLEQ